MSKKTICVDFDGTIVDHEFPGIGKMKPGVREALLELSQTHTIVISSCRTSKMFDTNPDDRRFYKEMERFLLINNIPYDRIDMGDEGKVVAVAYIDDRGIRFDNWSQVLNDLTTEGII